MAHGLFIALYGLSVVGASGDYILVVVHRLLVAVDSLVVENGV